MRTLDTVWTQVQGHIKSGADNYGPITTPQDLVRRLDKRFDMVKQEGNILAPDGSRVAFLRRVAQLAGIAVRALSDMDPLGNAEQDKDPDHMK